MSAIHECLYDCFGDRSFRNRGNYDYINRPEQPSLYLVTPRLSAYFEVPLLMFTSFAQTFTRPGNLNTSTSLAVFLSPPDRALDYKSIEACISRAFSFNTLMRLPSTTDEHCSAAKGLILHTDTTPLVLCTWAMSYNETDRCISFLYPVMHLNSLVYRLEPNTLTRFISGKLLSAFLSTTYYTPSLPHQYREVFNVSMVRLEPRVLIDLDISQPFLRPAVPDATTTTSSLLSVALEHISEL